MPTPPPTPANYQPPGEYDEDNYPATLPTCVELVRKLRMILLGCRPSDELGPISSNHFLAALADLDKAQRNLDLAGCFRARGD